MFNKSKLNKALNKIKKNRNNYFSGELNNIVFLDFDGVLNLDINNYTGNFKAKEPMKNLNRFCLENEFKIVVISLWRKSLNYKELLYESGLDKDIKILGATKICNNYKRKRRNYRQRKDMEFCYYIWTR